MRAEVHHASHRGLLTSEWRTQDAGGGGGGASSLVKAETLTQAGSWLPVLLKTNQAFQAEERMGCMCVARPTTSQRGPKPGLGHA